MITTRLLKKNTVLIFVWYSIIELLVNEKVCIVHQQFYTFHFLSRKVVELYAMYT